MTDPFAFIRYKLDHGSSSDFSMPLTPTECTLLQNHLAVVDANLAAAKQEVDEVASAGSKLATAIIEAFATDTFDEWRKHHIDALAYITRMWANNHQEQKQEIRRLGELLTQADYEAKTQPLLRNPPL